MVIDQLYRLDPRLELVRALGKPMMFALAGTVEIVSAAFRWSLPAIAVWGLASRFLGQVPSSQVLSGVLLSAVFLVAYFVDRMFTDRDFRGFEVFWASIVYLAMVGPCIIGRPRRLFPERHDA